MKEVCRNCGKEFEAVNGTKYCSDECRIACGYFPKNKEDAIIKTKVCPICGKEFIPKIGIRYKYCSPECRQEGARQLYIQRKAGNFKQSKKPVICSNCGKEFIPKNRNQTYCSEDCRKQTYREMVKEWRENHKDYVPPKRKKNESTMERLTRITREMNETGKPYREYQRWR